MRGGPSGDDLSGTGSEHHRAHNGRLGLGLFGLYLAIYTGFVLLNAFSPQSMEIMVLPGMNLAIAYGFGLILAALLLALLYGWLCRDKDTPQREES